MKTCFSEGKLMKQFGNPPLSKRTPPLSTNPLFLSNFFMTPSLSKFQKQETPPNFRGVGKETMRSFILFSIFAFSIFAIGKESPPLTVVFLKMQTKTFLLHYCNRHCVKGVQIRSYFWSVFSRIRTEYGEILGKIRSRNNSVFGHFSRSALAASPTIYF